MPLTTVELSTTPPRSSWRTMEQPANTPSLSKVSRMVPAAADAANLCLSGVVE